MIKRQIGIILFFILFSFQLFGQEFYLGLDGSPKAAAMGKTSLVSSTESSNLFYNPAALAEVKSKNIQINFYSKKGELDLLIIQDDTIKKEKGDFTGTLKVSGLSYSKPLSSFKNTTIGLGYQLIRDNQVDITTPSHPTGQHYEGGIRTLSAGMGTLLTDKLSIGAAWNYSIFSNLNGYNIKGNMYLFSSNYKNGPFKLSAKFRTGMDIELTTFHESTHTPVEYGIGADYTKKNNTIAVEIVVPKYKDYEVLEEYIDKSGTKFRIGDSYRLDTTKSLQFGYFSDDYPSTQGLIKLKGLTFGAEFLMNEKMTFNFAIEGSKAKQIVHDDYTKNSEEGIELELKMFKLLFGLTMR